MKGIFYAVGLGPGDKSLITYQAVEVLKSSPVVIVPDSGSKEQVAFDIVNNFVAKEEIILEKMPMSRDLKYLDQKHDEVALRISKFLDKGQDVAFANLGDPTIYGSVMYIHQRLKLQGYLTKIIPGVPSFCAAAASLNMSLCERGESLHIIPASYGDIDKALDLDGSKIFMKSGKSFKVAKEKILARKLKAQMVTRASMEGEKIYHSLEDSDETAAYFSLIVIR